MSKIETNAFQNTRLGNNWIREHTFTMILAGFFGYKQCTELSSDVVYHDNQLIGYSAFVARIYTPGYV